MRCWQGVFAAGTGRCVSAMLRRTCVRPRCVFVFSTASCRDRGCGSVMTRPLPAPGYSGNLVGSTGATCDESVANASASQSLTPMALLSQAVCGLYTAMPAFAQRSTAQRKQHRQHHPVADTLTPTSWRREPNLTYALRRVVPRQPGPRSRKRVPTEVRARQEMDKAHRHCPRSPSPMNRAPRKPRFHFRTC
jgi:hypothetical protein